MPTCKIFVAAKGVIRDAETSTISIFSILEKVTGQGFPFIIQEVATYSMWQREADDPAVIELNFSTRLNEHVLMQAPFRLDFERGPLARAIVAVGGVVVAAPGLLTFAFRRGEQEIARYDIAVTGPQPTAQVAGNAAAEVRPVEPLPAAQPERRPERGRAPRRRRRRAQ